MLSGAGGMSLGNAPRIGIDATPSKRHIQADLLLD